MTSSTRRMKRNSQTVLSMGYVALDIIQHEGVLAHRAGGTAANVASKLAFLGWKSQIVATAGKDAPGRLVRRDLERAGVGTRQLLLRDDAGTPVVIHEVTASGPRYRFTCPHCGRRSPRHRPPPSGRAYLNGSSPDVFFFDRSSAAALAVAEKVRERGGIIVFEPSTRGRAAAFARALALAHIVKSSSDRTEEFSDRLTTTPAPGQVRIVTEGPDGLRWRVGDGPWNSQPAFRATVVDSAGCGDWVTAAMLSALGGRGLNDEALTDALGLGQAFAALNAAFVGANGLETAVAPERALQLANRVIDTGVAEFPEEGIERATNRGRRPSRACQTCLG